jgi:hypothetical protein
MSLLSEIISLLSSEKGSLTEALLKTKVLLHTIGHRELVEWVNNELTGYPDLELVPDYRKLSAQVLVNAANGAWQFNSHPIPLAHLTAEQRNRLETSHMHQSLAVLEQFASEPGGQVAASIPMELNHLLGKGLANGIQIQRAWCQISAADILQILVQVRSRLLDFVLGMQDQVGANASDEEVARKRDSIDASSLFNNAIFGDNTTILVGNHNRQQVSNKIAKGDFSALADELRRAGVEEQDLQDLRSALTADEGAPELREQKFGLAVKGWLQRMLGKAVEASWQIELGVASSLLANALQAYYGWP